MKKLIFTLSSILISLISYAQNGNIAGQIVDVETGEELIGATVMVAGTSMGAVTDLSGNFQLSLVPGLYSIKISYVSYAAKTIEKIEVRENESTKINVHLSTDLQLEEIVIEAEAIQDNDIAMLKIQKKALAVQDGISSKEIKRIGASNAAESMQQITGATMEDGKYMVMRGLGDRYSLTQLNGVTLPSADPYRTSTSMDMIPADIIENIVTVKTFTADQPGNFTGGRVDITTKSIPEAFYLNFALSAGYNSQSSFIDEFITDGTTGSFDWLGFDDGTRSRPSVLDEYNEYIRLGSAGQSAILGKQEKNVTEREALDITSNSLKNDFIIREKNTLMNHGVDFSLGNQYSLFGKPLGINIGASYDKSYIYLGEGQIGLFSDIGSKEALQVEQEYSKRYGNEAAQLGMMFGLSYQLTPNNEIGWNTIYSHQGQIMSDITTGFWRETASDLFTSSVTNFMERKLVNHQLTGKHFLKGSDIRVEWILGNTNSSQDEPDIRMFGYTNDYDSEGNINWGMNRSIVGTLPSHFYRDLEDKQTNGKLDITLPLGQLNNFVKFGGSYSNKERIFNEYIYSFNSTDRKSYNHPDYMTFSQADGDLDSFFSNKNKALLGTFDQGLNTVYGFGNIYSDQSQIKNLYTGHEIIGAAYLMGVFELGNWKTILGLRAESTDISAVSKDANQLPGEVKNLDFLPSLNIIYKLNEYANLRMAVSQTLARPNMREIAPFASVGGVGQDIVLGNPDLQRTLIQNIDLRYEIYPKPGELIAFSGYYKKLVDPIIWQLTPKASTPEVLPINSEDATVAGIEAEFRKRLDFISTNRSNYSFGTNLSLIYSRVDKGDDELEILHSEQEMGRRLYLREWRPFQGQSPYIVNFLFSHYYTPLKWENSLSFNIWGRRLSYVTDAVNPDVYEQPQPSLNLVSRKNIGDNFSATISWKNILNMEYLQVYDYPSSEEYVFESFRRGTSISLKLGYRI